MATALSTSYSGRPEFRFHQSTVAVDIRWTMSGAWRWRSARTKSAWLSRPSRTSRPWAGRPSPRSAAPSSGPPGSARPPGSAAVISASEAPPRSRPRRSVPSRREEAGVELALRRQPRARAGTAERLADRGDHADFASPVDGSASGRRPRRDSSAASDSRPSSASMRGEDLGGRHDLVEPPAVGMADVHVLDEAQDVAFALEPSGPSAGCSPR